MCCCLGVFHFGVEGYVLATILTDTISTICLTLIARLYRYFNLKKLNAWLTRVMLKYSLPLIPNTICTGIINISDRYMVAFLISSAANGLYAIANKVPTVLIIVSNIFGEAWQISAVSEDKRSREQFFTQVLRRLPVHCISDRVVFDSVVQVCYPPVGVGSVL